MFNRALTILPFFYFGYLFRIKEGYIKKSLLHRNDVLLCFFIVYIIFVIFSYLLYPGQVMDVHMVEYYNFLICAVLIGLGLYLSFVISSKFEAYPKWILEIGKYSLLIFFWHSYIIAVPNKLLFSLGIVIPIYVMVILNTGIASIICCLLGRLISKYVPFLIGNR